MLNQVLSKNKRNKQNLIFGIVTVFFMIGALIFYYQKIRIPYLTRKVNIEAFENIKKVKGEEITVYVLKEALNQGYSVSDNKIRTITRYKNDLPSDYIKDLKLLNSKTARINIPANTVIIPSMLIDSANVVTNDLRKQDYSHIKLNIGLTKNQCVDIRYKKKDGTDYIVAAKKKIIDVNGTNINMNISETERQYINAASVEAVLTGGELYTTIYVDAENQPRAVVTYNLNAKILELINENPNVVKNAEAKLKSKLTNNKEK